MKAHATYLNPQKVLTANFADITYLKKNVNSYA